MARKRTKTTPTRHVTQSRQQQAWPTHRLEVAFTAGRYHQIAQWSEERIKLLHRDDSRVHKGTDWVYAATVMAGRWDLSDHLEALVRTKRSWPRATLLRFRLYWVIGQLRRSRYQAVRVFLAKWARSERNRRQPLSFELMQAMALERYFANRYLAANRWAQRAVRLARENGDMLKLVLGADLSSHVLLNLGRVREAIQALRLARRRASRIGARSFAAASLLTLLEIRAQMGLFPSAWACIRSLSRALVRIHPGDSYSRCQLQLSLAAQLILVGRARQARRLAESASDAILSSSHNRQKARLLLLLAHLDALAGRLDEAIDHLNVGIRELDRKRDLKILSRLEFFRTRLLHSGAKWPEHFEQSQSPRGSPLPEQDRLGELIAAARSGDRRALFQLADQGYTYFLWESLKPTGGPLLAIDARPGTALLAVGGDITVIRDGLGETLRNLLIQLSGQGSTKQELVETCWGYQYDPSRHDPLIHSALSRLRQILGKTGLTVRRTGDRYQLPYDFQVVVASEVATTTKPLAPLRSTDGLSWRQRLLLEWIGEESQKGRATSVTSAATRLCVSQRTALRELQQLVSLKRIQSSGRGRATAYHIVDQAPI